MKHLIKKRNKWQGLCHVLFYPHVKGNKAGNDSVYLDTVSIINKKVCVLLFLESIYSRDFPCMLRFLDSSEFFHEFQRQFRLNALWYVNYKIKRDS